MSDQKANITIFKTPSWGILGMAFLIMLGAKCFGYAPDLSWWVVTLPLWGPWALVIGFIVGFYVIGFLILCAAFIIEVICWVLYDWWKCIKRLFTGKDKDDEYKLHG